MGARDPLPGGGPRFLAAPAPPSARRQLGREWCGWVGPHGPHLLLCRLDMVLTSGSPRCLRRLHRRRRPLGTRGALQRPPTGNAAPGARVPSRPAPLPGSAPLTCRPSPHCRVRPRDCRERGPAAQVRDAPVTAQAVCPRPVLCASLGLSFHLCSILVTLPSSLPGPRRRYTVASLFRECGPSLLNYTGLQAALFTAESSTPVTAAPAPSRRFSNCRMEEQDYSSVAWLLELMNVKCTVSAQ